MKFFPLLYSVFLVLVANAACAQQQSIRTAIDKNKILIGEPIILTIELSYPEGKPGQFKLDSIPHFEIQDTLLYDSTTSAGQTSIKARYQISSFDSGHWVIPSWVMGPRVRSDTLPVDVGYTDFDPTKDYHDIKDIIIVDPEKKSKWWLFAIGGGLLIIGALIYYLKKKKPAPVVKKVALPNAFDEAMKDLDELKRARPAAKEYYSGLTDIFRLYIFRRKEILSLQKTTDDLVLQLTNIEMEKQQFEKLAQALKLSDFVKFAKYQPGAEDDQNSWEIIRESIVSIEKSHPKEPVPENKSTRAV